MNRVHPHTLGLALGIFLGLWHAVWSGLVWIGAAQWLLDLVFRLHMITPAYRVGAFHMGVAATLVLVTAGTGYVMGCVIGAIWNRCGLPRLQK